MSEPNSATPLLVLASGSPFRRAQLAQLGVEFSAVSADIDETAWPQESPQALVTRLSRSKAEALAGAHPRALIIGAAISEIWLSLNAAGRWLFGIYGGAAALALLGVFAFYLAYIAELPPPPPKPVKVKQRTSRAEEPSDEDSEVPEESEESEETSTDEPLVTAETDEAATESEPDDDAKLRNRRPTGKGTLLGRRKKARGSVAVDD